MTTTFGHQFHSEFMRKLAAEAAAEAEELVRAQSEAREARREARGEARGEGRAVLTVLDARGVQVPTPVREQILACIDLAQVDLWLRRAVTATTADEVTASAVEI